MKTSNKKTNDIGFYIIVTTLVLLFASNIYFIFRNNSSKTKTPSLFGYKFFIDMSESKAPSIKKGDFLIVKSTKDVKEQDILSFKNDENVIVTHRIVEVKIKNGKKTYITKGDNNIANDISPVEESSIEGIVIKIIPKLGSILLFLSTTTGLFVIVLVIISLILGTYLIKIIFSKEELELNNGILTEKSVNIDKIFKSRGGERNDKE